MTAASILLGGAILFWGYQTTLLPLAAVLVLAVIGPRLTSPNVDVSDEHFRRIGMACVLAVLGLAVYLLTALAMRDAIIRLVQWLPVVLAPLLVAQGLSRRGSVPLYALPLLRRLPSATSGRSFRLEFPYFAVCLLAGSAVYEYSVWFYPGLALLVTGALWTRRPRQYAGLAWAALIVVAVALGYAGHLGLSALQATIVSLGANLVNISGSRTDPYRTRTEIGHIGKLKLSDKILLRVKYLGPEIRPRLLHRASYNEYRYGNWNARDAALESVPHGEDEATWQIANGAAGGSAVSISEYLKGRVGVLSLPSGTHRVEGLLVGQLKRNPLGAVEAHDAAGTVTYTAIASPGRSFTAAPTVQDRDLTKGDRALFSLVVRDLGLDAMSPSAALEAIRGYFFEGFAYSLYQGPIEAEGGALRHFLEVSRAGHCEYFATATTLLLRAAGIPARYATGFSVQERRLVDEGYVVRKRHAHAWARAYIDGVWIDVDTTPPIWVTVEDETASLLEPLGDLFSWLLYGWRTWEMPQFGIATRRVSYGAASMACALTAWFLWHRRTGRRRSAVAARTVWPGADSEFYQIEQRLQTAGARRRGDEPMHAWIERAAARFGAEVDAAALRRLAELHQRYRFGPDGLGPDDRWTLASEASAWLRGFKAGTGRDE